MGINPSNELGGERTVNHEVLPQQDGITGNEPTMFWHGQDVASVISLSRMTPVGIIGGRGIGKTVLLDQLKLELIKEFGQDAEERILHVNGRRGESARSEIRDDVKTRQVMLIDNLDVLLTATEDDRIDDLMELKDRLTSWVLDPRDDSGSRRHFVATSSLDIVTAPDYRLAAGLKDEKQQLAWIIASSFLTQNLERYTMDPWSAYWKERWERKFDETFEKLLQPRFLNTWRALILRLTGGHPALFGPAVDHLYWLCSPHRRVASPETTTMLAPGSLARERILPPPDNPYIDQMLGRLPLESDLELEDEVARYVEDYLEKHAVRRIKSALRTLKNSTDETEKKSFRVLCQMALQGEDGAQSPDEAGVRRVVTDLGLVYQKKEEGKLSGRYIIPGAIVRRLILQLVDRLVPILIVRPSAKNRDSKGELVVRSTVGDQAIVLSGAPWRVLWSLYQNPNKILSIDALQKWAGLENNKAVSNAIQRLYKELRSHNLVRLIENERGKGYRLVLPTSGALEPVARIE